VNASRRQAVGLALLGAAAFVGTSAMLHRPGERAIAPVPTQPLTGTASAGALAPAASPLHPSAAPAPPPIAPALSPAPLPVPPLAAAAAPPVPPRLDPSPEQQQALIDAIVADDGDARANALNSLQNAPIALVLPLASQVLQVDADIRNRLTALRLIITASDRDTEREAVAQVLSQAAARTDDAVVAAQAREAYQSMMSGQGRG
jgi:hypothetical protein